MATKRHAHTVWEGNLTEGKGTVSLDYSGLGSYEVSWPARSEEATGRTSPEELIAAAHSSCYCMAFSGALAKGGTPPTRLTAKAEVTFVPGTGITTVHLTVEGEVPGIDEGTFLKTAEEAKANCPVSKALAGTEITLTASLVTS
ncbi:OsmC family protein [Streptomyces sp. CC228A]|uniref:OsmC family protein n=1 Tax=Streptomyces sp. CC228A TaxID=2898186 RepID=UPI001F3D5A18|nr:OsmC family protein [Streptomyces sp. CC228A]